ncbi:hypothetical protein AAVH_43778 [Aphelenchoides avenae]|nr:hypothetical protein AAVH_43778 [Aphelenchus avenae]
MSSSSKSWSTPSTNPKPPPPEVYLDWILEAWHDGITKDNVVNSFKTCGITTALDGRRQRMPNGCYKLAQKRVEAEAADLAERMAGFELDFDEDDVGNVSDAEIVDDTRKEGNNNAKIDCSEDSEF